MPYCCYFDKKVRMKGKFYSFFMVCIPLSIIDLKLSETISYTIDRFFPQSHIGEAIG